MRWIILIMTLTLMTPKAWAEEDCNRACFFGYDISACKQACRAANILERIADRMEEGR